MKIKYKFLEHTADIKFQAFGESIEEAFANSLTAMFHSMYKKKVEKKHQSKIKVKGRDTENLLYNFLEEFLYMFDRKGIFLSKVDGIKIDRKKMQIECTFSWDSARKYKLNTAIKAVTYNDMFIKNNGRNWTIQVVLDV